MTLRPMLLAIGLLLVAMHGASATETTAYPAKPITFVVPNAAGGSSDLLARAIGKKLHDALGQPVVIENRPGASEMLATEYVSRATPDGYTMAIFSNALAINETISAARRYDATRDLIPVAKLAALPLALLVAPTLPTPTLKELVAYAKANPGKLNYAHLGVGTPHYLTMEYFKKVAGIDITAVPYKSTSQIYVGILGGEIEMTLGALGGAVQFIQRGQVRALASMSAKRPTSLPDLQTIGEFGFPEFDLIPWMGVFLPTGTPPGIVQKLETAILDAVNSAEVRAQLKIGGLEPDSVGTKEFSALVKRDIVSWRQMIEDVGEKKQ